MLTPKMLATAAALGLMATAATAQSNAGLQEYVEACASCHGLTAHGDGPLAEYMTVDVPDLTRLAMENDGQFPMLYVIQVIDGRTGIMGHGSAMPVWGSRYEAEMEPDMGEYGAELLIRGRILALAEHIAAIQE